jgi:predicted transcriptional regulator
MTKNTQWQLGRRERQIMDIVFRLGRASVSQVLAELPDPPSYSAVRAMLGFLED